MSLLLLVLAPAVVAAFTAAVNLWIFWLRREEHAHRWLAVAMGSCAALAVITSLWYTSSSRVDAILAREAMLLAALPTLLGILRFCAAQLRVSLGRGERIGLAGTALTFALGLVPGLIYGPETVVRELAGFGDTFVDVRLTPLGNTFPLLFVPLGVLLVFRIQRRLPKSRDRSLILAANCASLAALVSDMTVLLGWSNAPLCFSWVQTSTGVYFTGFLLRRFVRSMEEVEANADLLQRAAEARARELRAKDLQLAHGARLAALGTLAAGLAHEINNPVAFIRSNLNYLEDAAREEREDDELDEVLAETEEGVARIRGIVEELARMAVSGDVRVEAVELGDVVESVLPTLRHEAGSDVSLHAELEATGSVSGDRHLLGQIVANLVVNAIQAVRASGGGRVTVTTRRSGDRVVLDVLDDGPGVPRELETRVFEPFFTTKPPGEGTGLGLSVTRQLVERQGGQVRYVPQVRGACFRVELPRASA
jgi:signal transduction histidine kinase